MGVRMFSYQRFQVDFLHHLMHANLSDSLTHKRILKMNLISRYRKFCRQWLHTQNIDSRSPHVYTPPLLETQFPKFRQPHNSKIRFVLQSLPEADIERIAFIIAYLLILVIQVGDLIYYFLCANSIISFLTRRARSNISRPRLQASKPMFSDYVPL